MAYYRKNNTISSWLGTLYVGFVIYQIFGWKGLLITVSTMFGLLFIVNLRGKYLDKRKEYKRNHAPCAHGVIGALYGYKECIKCQQEKIDRDKKEKRRLAEEAAIRKAEKEREYKEWVSKIRLPEYLEKMHPQEFEHLICDLFKKMGYEVEETPYSGDGGIDGLLKKNGDSFILQCKRVKGSVGEPVLRDLFGTMHANDTKEGFVVTTGKVSRQAKEWAKDKPIRILELNEIVTSIREYYKEDDIVPETFVTHTKRENICPKCGHPLKLVYWNNKIFKGCSSYPACRYTKSLGKGKYRGKKRWRR